MATPDLLDRQTAKQAGGAQLVEILNYDHRLIGAVVLCLARGISYVDKSLLFPVFSSSRRITSSTKAERSRLGKSSRSKLAVSVRIQNQTASFPDFGLPTLLRCSLGAILIVLGVQFRNCLLTVGAGSVAIASIFCPIGPRDRCRDLGIPENPAPTHSRERIGFPALPIRIRRTGCSGIGSDCTSDGSPAYPVYRGAGKRLASGSSRRALGRPDIRCSDRDKLTMAA
jgi:hypothetical protein